MADLDKALGRLARHLEERAVPYAVIGGIANLVWGTARATLDIDVTVWVAEREMDAFVRATAETFRILPGDPLKFIGETRVLPVETPEGIRIDLILGQTPIEERTVRRARQEILLGIPVRLCTPEDLVLHKIISDRIRDREDVEGILRRSGPELDRNYLDPQIESLAQEIDRPDILQTYREFLGGPGNAAGPDEGR